MFLGLQGWVDGIRALLDVGAPDYSDDRIKQFLFAGETVLNRRVRTLKTERHVVSTIEEDTCGQLLLPADFEQMRNVHSQSTHKSVEMVSPDEFYEQRNYFASESTFPEVCMIIGHTLHLYPEGALTDVSLVYYGKVPHLAAVAETNVDPVDQITDFTEFYPDALLYAAALNAGPYMLDDIRLPIWDRELTRILNEINANKQNEHYGSAPLKRRLRVMGSGSVANRRFGSV